jgi:hypothetical protein
MNHAQVGPDRGRRGIAIHYRNRRIEVSNAKPHLRRGRHAATGPLSESRYPL